MNPRLTDLWVYLAASPLLGLTLTLLAYQVALWFHQRCRFHPLANPVLVAIALVSAVLLATDMDYPQYFDGAQFVHFLLGPATVALAIPLYAQWSRLQAMATPLLIALVVGCLTAVISAWAVGAALGASHASLMSLAPKVSPPRSPWPWRKPWVGCLRWLQRWWCCLECSGPFLPPACASCWVSKMMQFGALPSGWRPTALVRPGLFRSVSRRVPLPPWAWV